MSPLKTSLTALLLFVLVFAAAFFLMGGDVKSLWDPLPVADTDAFQDEIRRQGNPSIETRGPDRPGPPDPPPLETAEEDPSEGTVDPATPGRLSGRVVDTAGSVLSGVSVALTPPAGTVTIQDGERFLVEGIPPGAYGATVWADGHIPARLADIVIRPGATTSHDVTLIPGVQPAGRVTDEIESRGIEGAVVTFGDASMSRTDANGRFHSPVVVPYEALEQITVTHPDYDREVVVRQAITDPTAINLSLTRGTAEISGRIVSTRESLPETALLSLSFTTGGRMDLKRQMTFDPKGPFTVPHIHQGEYDLAISFPGTRLPEIHRPVSLLRGDRREIEIPLGEGSTLRGQIVARSGLIGGRRVDLMGERGVKVASIHTAPDGSFTLPGIQEGSYRLKVWVGNPCFDTAPFSLAGDGEAALTIDTDVRRIR